MSDSIKELADLNTNARELLEKHSEILKVVADKKIDRYAYGYSDNIQVIQAEGFIKVEFNNKFEDGIDVDIDNSNFIIPIDGVYIIIFEFSHYKGDGTRQNNNNRCAIFSNGTNTQESIFIEVESAIYRDSSNNNQTNGFKTATFIQKLKKDDVVDVRVGNNFTADIYRSKISIVKI